MTVKKMEVYVGEQIKRLKGFDIAAGYNKRFCYDTVADYLNSYYDPKTLCLYGLRCTGKTTLMYQLMAEMGDLEHTCYILFDKDERSSIGDLKKVLNQHGDCERFFIDEITYLENFIDASSILADKYTVLEGKKLVMTGTDSLGFMLAKSDSLYDRVHIVPTTHISYKEYHHIFPDKTLDEYIEYGGTLTDGKTFYNDVISEEYTNGAIVENIQHSLEYYKQGLKWGKLLRIYDNDELTTYINKTIESFQYDFIAKVLNKTFKSHILGSARTIVDKHNEIEIDSSDLASSVLVDKIRQALHIKAKLNQLADSMAIEQIKSYLFQLDLIISGNRGDNGSIYFTQPGMRYAVVTSIMNVLKDSDVLSKYPREDIDMLLSIIDKDAKGRIMEDIISCDLRLDKEISTAYYIYKFTDNFNENATHGEVDIVLMDKTNYNTILLEVKHTDKFNEHQVRWFKHEQFLANFKEYMGKNISGKALLYQGKTMPVCDGILAVNAADFLCDTPYWIKEIQEE